MAKSNRAKRGSISITGKLHAQLREYCTQAGISVAQLVERLMADVGQPHANDCEPPR